MPGPTPGSRCTACNHPLVSTLNAAILAGQSDYKVAQAFNLTRKVVMSHRNNHMGMARNGGDEEDFQPDEGKSPRDKLLAVIRQLEKQAKGGSLRVDVARELRIAYAQLDEMGGGEPPAAVTWAEVDGLKPLLAALTRVLDRHPKVRDEVLEEVRRAGVLEMLA